MKIAYSVTKYMGYVAAVIIFCLMIITVADVIGRYFLSSPVPGAVELSALMLVIIVALGLGWCALARGHVKVDLIMDRLPPKVQFVIDNAMLAITFVFLGILSWQNFVESQRAVQRSSILDLSPMPFFLMFAIGLAIFCLCTLVVLIENIKKGVEKE